MLEGLAGEAVALGHLRGDVDATQFVWRLEVIYLSHHVSRRLVRDPDADTRALAAFEDLVAPSLPGRASAEGRAEPTTGQTGEAGR